MSSNASHIPARYISTRVRHRAKTHVERELHAVGFLLSRPVHSSILPRRLAVHFGDSGLPQSRGTIDESSSRISKEHPEEKEGETISQDGEAPLALHFSACISPQVSKPSSK